MDKMNENLKRQRKALDAIRPELIREAGVQLRQREQEGRPVGVVLEAVLQNLSDANGLIFVGRVEVGAQRLRNAVQGLYRGEARTTLEARIDAALALGSPA